MNIDKRFPGNLKKALTLSYDDGVETDIKLIDILDKHDIKCTFNINSGLFGIHGSWYHKRLSKEDSKKVYSNPNHEVAVHALTHPRLQNLPIFECTREVLLDKLNLEDMFGKEIRGMAYPFGTYSDMVVESLKACGIAYSRTTKNDTSFNIPKDWLRLNSTCHHVNPDLDMLCDKFLENQGSYKLFYVWGHSYEFLRDDNWEIIENFAKKMGNQKDIWYATNIEVYDYTQSMNQLRYSSNLNTVHNPTGTVLYFNIGEKAYSINPGETLHIEE